MSMMVNGRRCSAVKANRFMFWVDGDHDMTLKSCAVSYTSKTLDIAFYQMVDSKGVLCVERFLKKIADSGDNLILSLGIVDGAGQSLYTDEFKGIYLIEHAAGFDYDDKGEAVSRVVVEYKKKRRLRGGRTRSRKSAAPSGGPAAAP